MALQTQCMTPGAVFTTSIEPRRISVDVSLPWMLQLDAAAAEHLEIVMHNALEMAMAPYWIAAP